MLSPTRQAIADELQSKITATEGLLDVLREFHDIVVNAETADEVHMGLYRVFKMNRVSDGQLKDWMKFIEKYITSEIMDKEDQDGLHDDHYNP